MNINPFVLSAVGLAVVNFLGSQSAVAQSSNTCSGDGVCFEVGPVFPTSQSTERRNYALALVEELLEESVDETGGGAGDRKPIDFYATLFYQEKDYDTLDTPGLDSDTTGGIIGVTLRESRYMVGASLDYSREDATFRESAGDQDTDELGLNLYGTYFPLADNNLFISGVFRYANRDIDTRRNVQGQLPDGTMFDSGVAEGSTSGNDFSLMGGVGYSWQVQERTSLVLSGWLTWNEHNTDGYTESGSGAVPACIDAGTQIKVRDAGYKEELVEEAVFEERLVEPAQYREVCRVEEVCPGLPPGTGILLQQAAFQSPQCYEEEICEMVKDSDPIYETVKVSDAVYETVKVSDAVYRTLTEPQCTVVNGVEDAPSGDLRIEEDTYYTLDGTLTATVLHSIPINNGRVIPSLSLSYVHEFEDDSRTINARMADRPEQTVSIQTNEADNDYLRVGAAITYEHNQGATFFASYTGTVAHDWRNENLFSIGVRVLF